jgi:hypothetical protein
MKQLLKNVLISLMLLLIVSLISFAARVYAEESTFVADSSEYPRSVSWVVVDDVNKECLAQGARPVPEGMVIMGCAVYNNYECIIYTNKETTHEILGHEMRHCFQGAWHSKYGYSIERTW